MGSLSRELRSGSIPSATINFFQSVLIDFLGTLSDLVKV
jgi:hypothetical protein